jgi:hypothetical protein
MEESKKIEVQIFIDKAYQKLDSLDYPDEGLKVRKNKDLKR